MSEGSIKSSQFELQVAHAGSSKPVRVYAAQPAAASRGLLIVIQEIFGVTEHIRSVANRFAEAGFTAWAPSFYDPIERDVKLPYDQTGIQKGLAIVGQLGWDWPIDTIRAASKKWAEAQPGKPAGAIGYCWGGSVAWLASTRLGSADLSACISYYGSKTYDFRNETPKLPVLLHFGRDDHGIPMEKVEAFKEAQPNVPVEIYEAGHGFNRDGSPSYNEAAAKLALANTMAFLTKHGF